jgi:hypothetical protein
LTINVLDVGVVMECLFHSSSTMVDAMPQNNPGTHREAVNICDTRERSFQKSQVDSDLDRNLIRCGSSHNAGNFKPKPAGKVSYWVSSPCLLEKNVTRHLHAAVAQRDKKVDDVWLCDDLMFDGRPKPHRDILEQAEWI